MNSKLLHSALATLALLGVAAVSGCNDVSTELKTPV